VPVSREVFEGIEAVRLSGLTNMLDRRRVIEIAEAWALNEAAQWIREHPDLYARAIFQGLIVVGEP
jgi:hypothetical protein